ncbi:MAG: SDR family oxidoreductase [Rhodocyclaceae bacterium]|jgi:3-oxoacyl-[acyl-carrier protein] reductase|nr:SDR family oxidoreductase [Rhodocyclaceae bacterium]MCA3076804.1 SDR family oxidoreductase [Rhodocyclaceae bacterium]MCA3091090.1 SDR family oxidoreductase [Rhodocyclaceae bacterium]MCA3095188.1 SDR family oxidoreductase [Rhodocyclaceae bacterium]MCA3101682.1 SDR family oxidoreductase [Rhodocyclaceae bacterium]
MAAYPELNGRVVAITGAASGIGAVAAREFAAQGARVALVDIARDDAQALAAELVAAGGTARHVHCDISDEASVQAAVAEVTFAFGGLDVLVNCAGGYTKMLNIEQMPVEEFDKVIALNLRGTFLMCKAAIPALKASKAGRIINIASISGRTVHATSSPAYGAAKAGVIQLTRFLAWELGPHNITANSIAPITTLTPRVAALRTPEQVEQMAATIPLRRLAEPVDHVNAMLWLASDAASYINGVSLDVNGGRVMF